MESDGYIPLVLIQIKQLDLASLLNVQLLQDIGYMALDRMDGDAHICGNLPVLPAICHEGGYAEFRRG